MDAFSQPHARPRPAVRYEFFMQSSGFELREFGAPLRQRTAAAPPSTATSELDQTLEVMANVQNRRAKAGKVAAWEQPIRPGSGRSPISHIA